MHAHGKCVKQIQKSTPLHFIGHIFSGSEGQRSQGQRKRTSTGQRGDLLLTSCQPNPPPCALHVPPYLMTCQRPRNTTSTLVRHYLPSSPRSRSTSLRRAPASTLPSATPSVLLVVHAARFFSPDHHGLVMANNFAFMKLIL